ncbi:MAG: hypothetical protein AAFR47_14830 [Pseudomonadota bacterium]
MEETTGDELPHLPHFITEPGQSDFLFQFTAVSMIVVVLLIGALYFRLHALPEHMAHRSSRTQYQLVAILALVALFTHNNLFWIAALLLAAIQIPDFMTPLRSIAASLERMAPPPEQPTDASDPTADMEVPRDAPADAAPARAYPPAPDAPERGTL